MNVGGITWWIADTGSWKVKCLRRPAENLETLLSRCGDQDENKARKTIWLLSICCFGRYVDLGPETLFLNPFCIIFLNILKTAWKNQNKTHCTSLLQNFGQILGKEAKAPSFNKMLHMIASNESYDMKYGVAVNYQHFDSNSNWTVNCFFMILRCFKIEYFNWAIMRCGEVEIVAFVKKWISSFECWNFTSKLVYNHLWQIHFHLLFGIFSRKICFAFHIWDQYVYIKIWTIWQWILVLMSYQSAHLFCSNSYFPICVCFGSEVKKSSICLRFQTFSHMISLIISGHSIREGVQ